jgi:SAM-dependent methyltransferase
MHVANPCGFSDVDRAADPSFYVEHLDWAEAQPFRSELFDSTVGALEVAEGHAVLDVGCGTATFLSLVAPIVGPRGRITGVDASEVMLAAAEKRLRDRGVTIEFVVADATRLPFAAATFDRCAASRLPQHLEHPRDALAEMVRVARPGGRILVSDSDWGQLSSTQAIASSLNGSAPACPGEHRGKVVPAARRGSRGPGRSQVPFLGADIWVGAARR